MEPDRKYQSRWKGDREPQPVLRLSPSLALGRAWLSVMSPGGKDSHSVQLDRTQAWDLASQLLTLVGETGSKVIHCGPRPVKRGPDRQEATPGSPVTVPTYVRLPAGTVLSTTYGDHGKYDLYLWLDANQDLRGYWVDPSRDPVPDGEVVGWYDLPMNRTRWATLGHWPVRNYGIQDHPEVLKAHIALLKDPVESYCPPRVRRIPGAVIPYTPPDGVTGADFCGA